MAGIHVDFSSTDPVLAPVLAQIEALPLALPERHELEAELHLRLARACWARADSIRADQRDRERRQAALKAKPAGP